MLLLMELLRVYTSVAKEQNLLHSEISFIFGSAAVPSEYLSPFSLDWHLNV